jgi:hypothetical protein
LTAGSTGGDCLRGIDWKTRDVALPEARGRGYRVTMTSWKSGLLGLMLLGFTGPIAQAAVVVIHDGPRDPPPPVVEEHYGPRRGYVWVGGHHAWRHHHYVWTRGHYVRERRGYEYAPGRWERRDDRYEWHDGEWHPHR